LVVYLFISGQVPRSRPYSAPRSRCGQGLGGPLPRLAPARLVQERDDRLRAVPPRRPRGPAAGADRQHADPVVRPRAASRSCCCRSSPLTAAP